MRAICGLSVALLIVSVSVTADEAAAPPERTSSFGKKWISTRVSVGARFTYYWLEDARRCADGVCNNSDITGNFLGSLWGLEAQQHYFPNPYLEYRVVSAFGVGVMYDQLRARTLDWANEEQTETAGDGDLEVRGVGVYLVGRFRNRSRFEPYANVGFAWYTSRFYVSPGWAAPGRRFEVEDTQGWFGALGCKVRVGKHMGVDALFRHSAVDDVSARAYLGAGNRHRAGAFPMRYDALGIGAVYTF